MSFSVRTLPNFEKEAKRLAKKYPSLKKDLAALIENLESNPKQGTPLENDFYKVHMVITSKGRGKSGSSRIITCVKILKEIVYLTSVYDKSEKAIITIEELKFLAKQIPL